MPHMEDNISKENWFSKLQDNPIFRGIVLAILFYGYYMLLSPNVENIIMTNIAQAYRDNSTVEINSLTPIYDVYASNSKYNLSSYGNYSSTIINRSHTKFFTIDARILAMREFLTDYHSPMANSAEIFVAAADANGLDWRLVASISGVESGFGILIPPGSHNGWGWRGINGNDEGWSMFSSWDEAIEHITERIAIGYGTDTTPFSMEAVYCPPCGENPEHVWANTVTKFMDELQYYVENLGNLD